MDTGSLVLNTDATVDSDELIGRLTEAEFCGPCHQADEGRFLVGSRFMQLISFVGCSPYLRLTPPDPSSHRFCHLRFLGPWEHSRLLSGNNTRPPRCPHCRRAIGAWRQFVAGNAQGKQICAHCGERFEPEDLDWRRSAGSGRSFIQILEIFPGEATPVPTLFELLNQHNQHWGYFYLQRGKD